MKYNYFKNSVVLLLQLNPQKHCTFYKGHSKIFEFMVKPIRRILDCTAIESGKHGCRRLEMKRRGRNTKSDTDRFLVWILPFHNSCPQRRSRWRIWAHSRHESAEQHLAKILITAAFMNWTTALFVLVICSLYHVWQSSAVRSASEGTSSYSQAHGVEQQ